MTWTGQTFSVGQILTAAQLNNLQADITAQANGDSGAPTNQTASYASGSVDQAAIGASAVGQGELKTTNADSSATAQTMINPVNTEYAFHPQGAFSATSVRRMVIRMPSATGPNYTPSTSYKIFLELDPNGTGTAYSRVRYVQASPPYDLGDGDIPAFIFALIDNVTGDIVSTTIAKDAPWHYNTPRPQYFRNGRGYRKINTLEKAELNGINVKSLLLNPTTRAQAQEILADTKLEELEITQAVKNMHMDTTPHPYTGNDNTGKTVVLLDPVSDLTHQLAQLREDGNSINELLHDDYFVIDNTPSNRKGPAGLMIPSFRWKNTV